MEDLKIGDIKVINGEKRIVTGFTNVCGEIHPNTEPYTEHVEVVEETEEETVEEESAEIPDEEVDEEEPKYKCQYCGKVCKNALGLASHEEHCKEKPQD